MTGIILAAGRGSRLNGTTGDRPKCLLELGGQTMVERQIATLRLAGVERIVVVVGCKADDVREACGLDVEYVENTRFAETNSLYSLWLASPHLTDGFVVMNCDVLFHPQLLTDLLTARHEDALLVAYRGPHDAPYGDEEMKVRVRCGRVAAISKTMPPDDADAENLGIVKFGREGAAVLRQIMDDLVGAGNLRAWAPLAFGEFAKDHALHAIGTRGFPWTEIDFPADYRRAIDEILPAIDEQPQPAPVLAD